MDQGASMVATLNRLPVTHCCFGNHEADLQLEDIAMCGSNPARAVPAILPLPYSPSITKS
jgi:hypothetical protein